MTSPRIDVVMVRHPDFETQIRVFLDGEEVEVYDWNFDPGAGYEQEDVEEMERDDLELAPDFLKPVIAQLYEDLKPTFERWSTGEWK